ncbi:TetR/AcrR family transcriptional regulator [Serratia sp. UGAL515B_01]|uniref:TetR/AcrR family transcriptional regulator n=1 Tax=Serratia sp. UGAL515B_01 TaxID=2986763 RepID=UPI0029547763|nr:TetR/AcrR family transcriptional regulator [Serratia sp. UGAL515B_01]WON76568.1 TetR/AcrR family transcriptional regulator [Serratia sp. UGAL515B_01]
MSTHDSLIAVTDTLIQENGYQGFSYADLAKHLGIRKASIHYHFQTKTDLGIAYCEYKETDLLKLETALLQRPAGKARLKGYIDAFLRYAERGQMCGVHAMLSDSNLFAPPLLKAVNQLAQTDLRILTSVLASGRESGELLFNGTPADIAIIISSAIKGALMLNRIPPHDACNRTMSAILKLLTQP